MVHLPFDTPLTPFIRRLRHRAWISFALWALVFSPVPSALSEEPPAKGSGLLITAPVPTPPPEGADPMARAIEDARIELEATRGRLLDLQETILKGTQGVGVVELHFLVFNPQRKEPIAVQRAVMAAEKEPGSFVPLSPGLPPPSTPVPSESLGESALGPAIGLVEIEASLNGHPLSHLKQPPHPTSERPLPLLLGPLPLRPLTLHVKALLGVLPELLSPERSPGVPLGRWSLEKDFAWPLGSASPRKWWVVARATGWSSAPELRLVPAVAPTGGAP